MNLDFTVVIPTYNGAQRLPLVLDKLQQQTQTEGFHWEIIVIDNNSQDQTAQIVQKYQQNWSAHFPLKYYFEPQQGLAFARSRGIQEANSPLIGFLDDDNLPDSEWVFQAYQFSQTHPQAGAFGGQVHAAFEGEPPENINQIAGFLAIRERGDRANLYQPETLSLPTGAGLVIRRQVWLDCFPQPSIFVGRVGGSMVGGEDWEPLIYMHKAGWEIWYNPKMHINHKIPSSRLTRDYLLSLVRGSCLCFFPLKMLVAKPQEKPLMIVRTVFGNLLKAARHYLIYRDQLQDNVIAACEGQIYLGRIESFFYYLKMILKISK